MQIHKVEKDLVEQLASYADRLSQQDHEMTRMTERLAKLRFMGTGVRVRDPLDLIYFWLRGLGPILSQNPIFLYYYCRADSRHSLDNAPLKQ